MPDSDDDTYTVPIADQRIFGAGIKRKRVPFVPASSSSTGAVTQTPGSSSLADRYLSIVGVPREATASAPPDLQDGAVSDPQRVEPAICDICEQPIDQTSRAVPHESSLAHQVCLKHSHGASHIDRTTKGFSYLQAYGWDPDSRRGLGAAGEGRLYPIKPKEKRDTLGVGAEVTKLKSGTAAKRVEKLNAKQVREMELKGVRKKQRLQSLFTANDDVIKYLGAME